MLGYPDEAVSDDDAALLDYTTSKVGGHPDWINPRTPEEDPSCLVCRGSPVLLAQIYAPLEAKSLHRTLYLFACTKPSCQNNPHRYFKHSSQTVN